MAALSIVVIALLTTVASALGPIMLRAVEQSALQQSLSAAGPGRNDIVFTLMTSDSLTIDQAIASTRAVAIDSMPGELFEAAITLAETGTLNWRRSSTSPTSQRVRVAADPDGCARFVITAGRCANGDADVVVPAADLAVRRTELGASITVGGDQRIYRVVGAYDPTRSRSLVLSEVDPVAAGASVTTSSDLVMSIAGQTKLAGPIRVSARLPLIRQRLGLDEVSAARSAVAHARQAALEQGQLFAVDTELPSRLDEVVDDNRAAQTLVLVVGLQAIAVAWFSAIVVMTLVSRVRAREWALGRLRGVRRLNWLVAVFAEPLFLLWIGTVAALGLGTLLARAATHRWLRAGTAIEPLRAPVLLAAGLAVAGLLGALAAASLRSARAPLAALLTEGAEPARVSRFVLIIQVVVLALAGASAYQLRSGESLAADSSRLALLAPALLAAALGVLVIGAASRIVRGRTRRPARSVAGILLVRSLARMPSALQRNVAVAIVVALAVFATQLAALSARNLTLRADGLVGADTVLDLRVPRGVNLRDAVRAADPGGAYAMAVLERRAASDGNTSRIVAVDTTRLPGVMRWHASWAGLAAGQLATRLRPARPGAIAIYGARLTVQVRDLVLTPSSTVPGTQEGPRRPEPYLHAVVSDGFEWDDIDLGLLTPEVSGYSSPLKNCVRTCRLVHFYLDNSADPSHTPYTASFTVAAIATDRQPAAELAPVLRDNRRWQPWATSQEQGEQAAAQPAATPSGLHINATDQLGQSKPGVSSADAPDPVPVLGATRLEAELVAGRPDARVGTGLDGQRQLITLVGRPAFLPRSLDDGVLVDLSYISLLSAPAAADVVPEVWLRAGAPKAIGSGLAKAGITVTGTEELRTTRHTLTLSGAAEAATTNLLLVAVAALIGIAVIAATQLIDATRRRTVWAVAHSSRIGRRRMSRLVLLEIAAPAALGTLIGALAGAAAIWLAGTRLPLFAPRSVGPPLDVSLRWALGGLVLGMAVVVVAVVAALAAAVEAARSAP